MSCRPRSVARVLSAVAVLAAALAAAAPASAAPADPIISLTELRAELAAAPGGTLPGYFKTVLRGSSIENVPVEVLAVTGGPTDDLDPRDTLVLFEARGPVIERTGGVAQGMSGSPVYVNVRGVDRLVGALAYGEEFTRNGAALATPIEAMTAIEQLPTTGVLTLNRPVLTASGAVDRVVIETDAGAAALANSTGAVALQPLTSLYIGGLSPSSPAYRMLAGRAGDAGIGTVPLAAALSTGNERFTTAFVPGAAVAALATRGDLWVGGVGTVTYTSGDKVLAFGHPLTGEGTTQLYLHNAWVDGVWPSNMVPHKLGTPGALRGTLTQDRAAGIMGVTSFTPDEVVIRSAAERLESGASAVTRVGATSYVVNSGSLLWQGVVRVAGMMAPLEVYDSSIAPGSAITTTTVVVSNGSQTYTIVRKNVFEDQISIPMAVTADLDRIASSVAAFAAEGREPARIVSVEMTSALSAQRTSARVVGVSVDGGLKPGDNLVRVALRQIGVATTRSVDVTLTLPADSPLDGMLTVSGGWASQGDMSPSMPGADSGQNSDAEPQTLEDLAKRLAEETPNDRLTVSYYAGGGIPVEPSDFGDMPAPIVSATSDVGFAVSGAVSKQATSVRLDPLFMSGAVTGVGTPLLGWVEGAKEGSVEIWARSYGEAAERLVATATVSQSGSFDGELPPFATNTRLRAEYLGSPDSLNSSGSMSLRVATRCVLNANTVPRRGAPVTLSARVTPPSFGGSVVFERRVGRSWRRIATVAAPAGTARVRFTPAAAATVRARTIGSPSNGPGVSRALTIRPR